MKLLLAALAVSSCITVSAQVPLPDYLKTIENIYGFTDGTGYQLRSKNGGYSGTVQERNNKTMRYSDRYGKMELWTSYRDIDSPNGMNVIENYFPVGCGLGKMTKENCHEWSTHIRLYDSAALAKRSYPWRDTVITDKLFPIAITNNGLLICSKPRLKGENVWFKTELKKLTDIYTHNLKTGEEKLLYEGELPLPNYMDMRTAKWCLTPNSKIFCYYGEPGKIYYWNVETGKQLIVEDRPAWRLKTETKLEVIVKGGKPELNMRWWLESVSDFETLITIRSDNYPYSYDHVIIDNITGAELARFSAKGISSFTGSDLKYTANTLYTINQSKASITFWKLDDTDLKPDRIIQLDTIYMADGPKDNTKTFKIRVLTPNLAAVWNSYDRLYVMDLTYGKAKIVYSDIYGQRRFTAEANAAKAACEEKIRNMKFKVGTTIVHQNTPYIVSSYDCYTNQYTLATRGEGWHNPPYSTATIMRYSLRAVKTPMLTSATFSASELSQAAVADKQLEACTHCHGQGGEWTATAVTGPSVLVNGNTNTAEYKPLGTMVYNYEPCRHCGGACWFVR